MRLAGIVLVPLALLAALLFWWSARDERVGGAIAPERVEPATPLDAPAVADPAGAHAERGIETAPAARDVAGASAPEQAADLAAISLVQLRGVLRRSDDGAPAAHAWLVFFQGGDASTAVTDAEGRFETLRSLRPGAVQVGHRSDLARAEYASQLDVEPRAFVVPAGDALGEVPPVELTLLMPDAWIVVEVRLPDGRPAVGAFVEGALAGRLEEGRAPIELAMSKSDELGRSRIAVPHGGRGARLALLARHEGLASDVVEPAAPWQDGVIVLALEAGGELRVRVVDEAGAPVAGRSVDVELLGRDDFIGGRVGTTQADGAVDFRALPPGRRRAFTWVEEVRERISAEIEIARGELHELTLEVPRLGLQLAAAGRVVDEAGAPLAQVELALEHESGAVLSTRSDSEGRFEFHAAPCGVVSVALDRDSWGDEYDPPRRRAAFGTRGLEFARRAAVAQETLLLEVVDARTGERVRGAAVMPHRAPNLGDYSMFRAEEGLVLTRFKALETLAFGVAAPGYRRRFVPRTDLLPGGEGAQARVELERGFERVLRVRGPDGAPVRGAELRVAGELVATGDVEGLARVDLPAWPTELAIAAPGFAPSSVDPADFLWDLGPAVVELEPLAAERK